MINDIGLTQVVGVPAWQDNVFDLIITSKPSQINRTQTLPGIADHNVAYTELDIRQTKRVQTPRQVPLYHKADWTSFRDSVSALADNIAEHESTQSVEELWQLIADNLHTGIQSFIPHKTLKGKASCPWTTKDLAKKIRRTDKA